MAESRRRRKRRRSRLQGRKKQEENKALKTVLQQTVRTAKNFRYMRTEEFKQWLYKLNNLRIS